MKKEYRGWRVLEQDLVREDVAPIWRDDQPGFQETEVFSVSLVGTKNVNGYLYSFWGEPTPGNRQLLVRKEGLGSLYFVDSVGEYRSYRSPVVARFSSSGILVYPRREGAAVLEIEDGEVKRMETTDLDPKQVVAVLLTEREIREEKEG